MAEQGTLHFEVIDKNKQKAHEDKVEMKSELIEFIEKSNSYPLALSRRIYLEYFQNFKHHFKSFSRGIVP